MLSRSRIPDDVSQENRKQLEQLNDLLLSGAILQSKYDKLVPFLLKKPVDELGSGAAHTVEQEESLNRLCTTSVNGIQIRCSACGATNDTANGNHCEECGSLLTTSDETAGAGAYGDYYGARLRGFSRA
jgi:hypothetical protein